MMLKNSIINLPKLFVNFVINSKTDSLKTSQWTPQTYLTLLEENKPNNSIEKLIYFFLTKIKPQAVLILLEWSFLSTNARNIVSRVHTSSINKLANHELRRNWDCVNYYYFLRQLFHELYITPKNSASNLAWMFQGSDVLTQFHCMVWNKRFQFKWNLEYLYIFKFQKKIVESGISLRLKHLSQNRFSI